MPRQRIGGSFAPPLDPDGLARYRALAASAPPQVGEAMGLLADLLEVFWQTPRSTRPGRPHPSGVGTVVPLEDAEVQRLDPHVPWPEELDLYGRLFDRLDPVREKEARDAAYHLLWYARELALDREPLTADQLPPR